MFHLVFTHRLAICSFHLEKASGLTITQQPLPHAFSELLSPYSQAADGSLHCTMNATAQHKIVLHLNVLPFSSTLHHKTQ